MLLPFVGTDAALYPLLPAGDGASPLGLLWAPIGPCFNFGAVLFCGNVKKR